MMTAAAGLTVACAAAMTAAATAAAPAGAIAAAEAAGLVLVVHQPAGAAEHDTCNNDCRQIEICCQKSHHKDSLLSVECGLR